MQQRIPITAAGAEKLKAELDELKRVKRPAVVQAIAEAREKGDLSGKAPHKENHRDQHGQIVVPHGKMLGRIYPRQPENNMIECHGHHDK